jgi:hypothetical protein
MYKFCLALLLTLPVMTHAQTAVTEETPIGSFTGNYVYQFNDAQYGHNRSLMGWSAVPEVNFTRHLGFQGDFSTMYVRSIYPGETHFLMSAGPRYTFAPRSRFTPFIYAEGGEMRISKQRTNIKDWNPIVRGGFGFEHRISKGIAFTLVPGEYLGQYQDDGSWNHSFSTHAGITFNLYKGI